MTQDEIKKAVEVGNNILKTVSYNPEREEAMETLLQLAQDYLKVEKNKDFEDFLTWKHAEQYIGTKDCMIDDFNKWVCDLGADELIELGNKFAHDSRLWLMKKLENLPETIKQADLNFRIKNDKPHDIPEPQDIELSKLYLEFVAQAIRSLFEGGKE